jgi:transposase
LRREYALSIDAEEKKLLAHLIREKERDLKLIGERRRGVIEKLKTLLTGHEDHLTSIPGVADTLAAELAAHSDDMDRFATVDKYLSDAGIAPIEKASGKTKRAVQNHKGNRLLNHTMYLTAICQVRYNPKAKDYYQKKIAEGKTKKHALRCVMKRTAMLIYGMLRNGTRYDAEYGKRPEASLPTAGLATAGNSQLSL